MWHNNILETLGNTPLIKINTVAQHIKATVLAKVEYFNPGNSVKDRIALKMVEDAERAGILKPGGTIIEGTSGNTGMGLALAAVVKGYRCIFTITDKQSPEKIDILRALGAEVIVCPTNVEPEDPQSYYSVSKRLAKEIPNSFYPNQYDNLSNRQAHYETTGPEIWAQTEGRVTHLVAGMGTCGTICGTSKYLKSQNPAIRTIGVDTYGSLFKKLHETGEIDLKEVYPYMTEGIGEDFVPANCDMTVIDKILKVTDKDAAIMARKLARLEGLFVGWSCGSAMHGALEFAQDLGQDAVVVVILPDHGTRYLGKIYNDTWMRDYGFLEEGALATADEVLRRKGSHGPLLALAPTQTVAEAILLMRERNISQIPVVENGNVVGSVNESRILNALIDDPNLRSAAVGSAMNDPFPFVLPTTRIDVISKMINKDNPAVLVQKHDGSLDIITKYDLISVLAGN
jgi:cystathionine beta-synthase